MQTFPFRVRFCRTFSTENSSASAALPDLLIMAEILNAFFFENSENFFSLAFFYFVCNFSNTELVGHLEDFKNSQEGELIKWYKQVMQAINLMYL